MKKKQRKIAGKIFSLRVVFRIKKKNIPDISTVVKTITFYKGRYLAFVGEHNTSGKVQGKNVYLR